MIIERCSRCGKIPADSSNPCLCPPLPGKFLRGKTIEGPKFVRLILSICVLVTLAAVGIFFLVVRLRVAHGLPGLD